MDTFLSKWVANFKWFSETSSNWNANHYVFSASVLNILDNHRQTRRHICYVNIHLSFHPHYFSPFTPQRAKFFPIFKQHFLKIPKSHDYVWVHACTCSWLCVQYFVLYYWNISIKSQPSTPKNTAMEPLHLVLVWLFKVIVLITAPLCISLLLCL